MSVVPLHGARARREGEMPPDDYMHDDNDAPSAPSTALPDGIKSCSDLGNAHRLLTHHGASLRHAPELGWVSYSGPRWETRSDAAAHRAAHDVARRLAREAGALLERAATITDPTEANAARKTANALATWARKSQDSPRIEAMLKESRWLEGIAVSPDAFDADPMVLNCANGTISDLRCGVVRRHDRADMLTKLAPIELIPDAPAPTWLKFLDVIFDGRQDLITFVQRALGYSLSGSTREQCFFVLHGSGKNGKSTLLEAIRHVLGDYSTNTSADVFMRLGPGQSRGPENDIARLRGARFVCAVETDEGKRLDEARIKRLTGSDVLTARFLFKEFFDYVPHFKLWLACNHKPEIVGVDEAIWRRVKLIPFDVTIPEEHRDKNLLEKLRAEAPGILAWLVQGSVDYWAHGLAEPAEVSAATMGWRDDANHVAGFMAERCVTGGESMSVTSKALHGAYAEWCKAAGEEPLSMKRLAPRLLALGFKRDRDKRARLWRGLTLSRGDDEGGDG